MGNFLGFDCKFCIGSANVHSLMKRVENNMLQSLLVIISQLGNRDLEKLDPQRCMGELWLGDPSLAHLKIISASWRVHCWIPVIESNDVHWMTYVPTLRKLMIPLLRFLQTNYVNI